MQMDFIEVLKSVWQLGKNDFDGAAIHLADVIPFERIDKAFRHTVGLYTAHRRMNGRQTQLPGNVMHFMGAVNAALVTQELQKYRTRIDIAKSLLRGFN